MDAMGLNVAASDVTSDYWQGDEAKFKKTYAVGSGAIFIDELSVQWNEERWGDYGSTTNLEPC